MYGGASPAPFATEWFIPTLSVGTRITGIYMMPTLPRGERGQGVSRMRHLAIVAGLVVSLGIAGCGNDDLDLDSLFDGATTTTTMAPTTTMGATTTTSTTSTSSTIVTTTMPVTTTTSTTSSTIVTTTLPVTTTTSTTTTTLAGGATSILTFTLDDAVNLGALQFDVGYANAAGNFIAGALGPDCTTNGGVGGFGAYNDNTASSVASVGLISLAGFTGPMDVATCRFDGAPLAGDFTITVTDASDPLTNPVSPLPAVSISVAPE